MASSVTDANPQQGGKKGKDKNKDVVALVDEKLAEINSSMSALTERVDDMDRRLEELESEGDMEGLCGEVKAAMISVGDEFRKELHALQASKAFKDDELKVEVEACKAEVEACKATVWVNKLRIRRTRQGSKPLRCKSKCA